MTIWSGTTLRAAGIAVLLTIGAQPHAATTATTSVLHYQPVVDVTLPANAAQSAGTIATSCPSATTCVGLGSYGTTNISSAAPAGAIELFATNYGDGAAPASELHFSSLVDLFGAGDLSCYDPGDCVAVATGDSASSGALVQDAFVERGNKWASMGTPVPWDLVGISCVIGAAFCIAVGDDGSQGVAVPWMDGHWGSPTMIPMPTSGNVGGLDRISCVSTTWCEAAGAEVDNSSGTGSEPTYAVFTSDYRSGAWSRAVVIGGATVYGPTVAGISCESNQFCLAVGSTSTGFFPDGGLLPEPQPMSFVRSNGSWSGVEIDPVPPSQQDDGAWTPSSGGYYSGVACTGEVCMVAGTYDRSNGDAWLGMRVQTTVSAASGPLHAVSDPSSHLAEGSTEGSSQEAVSCPTPSRCVFAGVHYQWGNASTDDTAVYMLSVVLPSPPSGLSAHVYGNVVKLSWRAQDDPFSPVGEYLFVQYGGGKERNLGTLHTDSSSSTCYVRGLRPDTRYGFELQAANGLGKSAYSGPVYATTS